MKKYKIEESAGDELQVLFDKLVPDSGPASTKEGELVRAMMLTTLIVKKVRI